MERTQESPGDGWGFWEKESCQPKPISSFFFSCWLEKKAQLTAGPHHTNLNRRSGRRRRAIFFFVLFSLKDPFCSFALVFPLSFVFVFLFQSKRWDEGVVVGKVMMEGPSQDEKNFVTLKQAPEQVKASEKARMKAVCCCLSDAPLKTPIVVCDLGKLYNKEAIIEFILERRSNPENEISEEFQHLKSLKDVHAVIFEPNPNYDELDQGKAIPFLCPITKETFNGIHPFVVLKPCSHALSNKILKETKEKRCAVCEAPFEEDDVIPLNADEETMEKLKDRLGGEEGKSREPKKGRRGKEPRKTRPRRRRKHRRTEKRGGVGVPEIVLSTNLFSCQKIKTTPLPGQHSHRRTKRERLVFE